MIKRQFSALLLCTLLAGCDNSDSTTVAEQIGPHPKLDKPSAFLLPPISVPSKVDWAPGQTPRPAAGLKIESIAQGLAHPRMVYQLPNNDILVAESNAPSSEAVTTPKQLISGLVKKDSGKGGKGGNRITLLRKDAQGHWQQYPFIQNLNSPFGMVLIGQSLYIADADALLVFPYQPGDLKIDSARGKRLADLPSTINHHWTKSLTASPEGKHLYVGVGSNSNITENGLEAEYRRAAILEVDPHSGASRIYADGLRNPTGVAFDPTTKKLWTIVNERDEIGANLVPDYLTQVKEGAFYGWPYSYYGQHVDRRVQPPAPDKVASAVAPDYALSSHVAPLGMQFAQGSRLPGFASEGLFISEHGSWNRKPLNGYRVSYVQFSQGKPVGQPKTVVDGFVSDDQQTIFGAPVGLTLDNQGALIIADDVGNHVWRVSAAP
ncbi:PQQ-dependent sugar dehydrogenase [Rosenbergiella nectarea]|uniref:PQQ-dependent sugar dehydrogenase n=1 Tax=Rosenbergiella nectarea TaxID=988801 RepID=UPI001F4E6B38|nr:sorbosone dehydrogenase family protein [Rosenbergiella nectarea]